MNDGIVVTGGGCVSALGRGIAETMANLYAGRIQDPWPVPVPSTVASPPPVFAVREALGASGRQELTRTSMLALEATTEALEGAWGGLPRVSPERVGVCLGTTVGCTLNDEPFYRDYRENRAPDPGPIRRFVRNDVSRVVADKVGARGPVVTLVNACASGTDAIGQGADWIRRGVCDLVVAGGADELSRYPYLGFVSLKNTSRERCRPFDLERKGLNLGEGAAVLVLEREADVRRRSGAILSRIMAYASASDAYHPTAPHPEGRGLRKAILLALESARLSPERIGFVNAHGTGTSENDRVEGRVLASLFPGRPPVFSTKGYTGHTTGAAGAIEALFTIQNLLDRRVPRSGGFETSDPACVIVPTTETQDVDAKAAISDSLAFGGTNSVLVFGRGEAA